MLSSWLTIGLYIQKEIAVPTPNSATDKKPIKLVYNELMPLTSFPRYRTKYLLIEIPATSKIILKNMEIPTLSLALALSEIRLLFISIIAI